MNKRIAIFAVVLILAGVAVYAYQKHATAPTTEQTTMAPEDVASSTTPTAPAPAPVATTTPAPAPAPTSAPKTVTGHFSTGEEMTGNDIQVVQINYTDTGFSPKEVTIKPGDYVIFKNTSTRNFRVASNPHPSHTDYPGFDSVDVVAPGAKYQFQFMKVGNWGFHNHLNPSEGGTVHVAQ